MGRFSAVPLFIMKEETIKERMAWYLLKKEIKVSEVQMLILMFLQRVTVSNEQEIRLLFQMSKNNFDVAYQVFRANNWIRKRGAKNIWLTENGKNFLKDVEIRLRLIQNQIGNLNPNGVYRYLPS